MIQSLYNIGIEDGVRLCDDHSKALLAQVVEE